MLTCNSRGISPNLDIPPPKCHSDQVGEKVISELPRLVYREQPEGFLRPLEHQRMTMHYVRESLKGPICDEDPKSRRSM